MKLISLLCLLCLPATAAPILQGTLTSTGTSVNNTTTAVPFALLGLPLGSGAIQCDADVRMAVGAVNSVTASISTGLLVSANSIFPYVLKNTTKYIAIVSVSGTANCNTFYLDGETVSAKIDSSNGVSSSLVLSTIESTGQLAQSNKTLFVNQISVQAQAADGSASGWILRSQHDGCIDYGVGVQDNICASNNELRLMTTSHLPTTFVQQLSPENQNAPFWIVSNAPGDTIGELPVASLRTCDAARKGGRQTLASDGRSYYCDGSSSMMRFALMPLPWSAVLDFGSIPVGDDQEISFVANGLNANDLILCGGLDQVEATDPDLIAVCSVGAANLAHVRVLCTRQVGLPCANPPPLTFTIAAIR